MSINTLGFAIALKTNTKLPRSFSPLTPLTVSSRPFTSLHFPSSPVLSTSHFLFLSTKPTKRNISAVERTITIPPPPPTTTTTTIFVFFLEIEFRKKARMTTGQNLRMDQKAAV
jgi:membrane protease YdiL (CAAX protease family)